LYNSLEVQSDDAKSLLFRNFNVIKADVIAKKVPLNKKNKSVELIYKGIDKIAKMHEWTIDSEGPDYKKMPDIIISKEPISYSWQGMYITAYINMSDMEAPQLVYLTPKPSRSVFLDIDPPWIASKNSDGTIKYYRNNDDKVYTINIKPDPLVYNNFSIGSIDDIKSASDRIETQTNYRFRDTGGDYINDVIYITSIESFIIEEIDGYKISSKNMSVELDPDNENIDFVIKDFRGEKLLFSDIKTGGVINISESKDDDFIFYEIEIYDEMESGTISEIYKTKNKVTGQLETFYKITEHSASAYEYNMQFHDSCSQAESDKNLEIGTKIDFLTAANGKIIFYKTVD